MGDDTRAGRRSADPSLKKLTAAVSLAAQSAEEAKRTGQETARDVAVLLGHFEGMGVQLAALVRELVVVNQRLESIDRRTTSLDTRVGIQNGRVGNAEERLLSVETWRGQVAADAAFKRGVFVIPVGAVKVVAKGHQAIAAVLTLALGVVTGANIGALVAFVVAWLGLDG